MAVAVIAGAMAVLDVALAIGIALYAVRQVRSMVAPQARAWRSQWEASWRRVPGLVAERETEPVSTFSAR